MGNAKGKTVAEIAEEAGVGLSAVYKWVNRAGLKTCGRGSASVRQFNKAEVKLILSQRGHRAA